MAFIIFFLFCLKKFEKVEKTGIISSKFSLQCTPSVILGMKVITRVLNVFTIVINKTNFILPNKHTKGGLD